MRDQLDALRELALLDRSFRQLDSEHEQIAGRLADLTTDVERFRALLDREKAQLADAEQVRKSAIEEANDLVDRISRSTGRAAAARNTRERDAATREVEVLKREREERQARAAEIEKALVDVRASLERHEKELAELEQALVQEQAETASRREEIDAQRARNNVLRTSLTAKVRPDLLRKYEGLRERKGTAVADVEAGICRTCHVSLPPQMFAKILADANIHQCPNCQRILLLRQPASGA